MSEAVWTLYQSRGVSRQYGCQNLTTGVSELVERSPFYNRSHGNERTHLMPDLVIKTELEQSKICLVKTTDKDLYKQRIIKKTVEGR